jgi:hypothetical protein
MAKGYTDMTITPYSTKLLRGIMSTFPTRLTGSNLTMVANTVVPPRKDNVEQIKAYLVDCLENKIIPFSQIEWSYTPLGLSVRKSSVIEIPCNVPPEIKNIIDERLLEGGKINTMTLSLEVPYVNESLRKFEKEFMDLWFRKGYSPEAGNFRCIEEHHGLQLLLTFDRFNEAEPGFTLSMSDTLQHSERINLTNWFNRLKQAYQKS